MNDCRKSIGWADYTWNPVTGCLHACPYCYARVMARRFGKTVKAKAFKPQFHRERLPEPHLRLRPAHIFVGSACDLYGAWVPRELIEKVELAARLGAPWHRYYFLTKNPGRYDHTVIPQQSISSGWWRGFTAEDQAHYDFRLKFMPDVGCNFVSLEPLQGPVRIGEDDRVDWVIVGEETGNRKERVKVEREWVEAIIADCRAKGIPVFVKANFERGYPQEKP